MTAAGDVPEHRLRRALVAGPDLIGAAAALLFWFASLRPTLLPRSWVSQAAVSAISLMIGYGVGVLLAVLGRAAARWSGSGGPGAGTVRRAWQVLAAVAAAVVVVGVVVWQISQGDQRDLVSLPHLSPLLVLPMLVLTAVLSGVLLAVARVIGFAVKGLDRRLATSVNRVLALVLTVIVVVAITVTLSNDVVAKRLIEFANDRFGTLDTTTAEGVEQPTSPLVSGSPDSLAAWDTLGLQGRSFVAGATSVADLEAFHGPQARVDEPIRVYAGLRTADTPEERADVVVQELERTGAFDREVLCVVTVTGTGWVNPVAASALEYLHAGDTAMAAMQYSYLPSWISFLVDKDKASEAGVALIDAVQERWVQLPEASRPRLVLYGESLGSFGAEAAFVGPDAATSVAAMTADAVGVLLVGPTNGNEVWRQLEAAREAGTPSWLPVFDGGRTVRFMNRASDLPDAPWSGPRVLYMQHPSDPVTWWNWETLWRPQPWSHTPTGFDVPEDVGWFPGVTFVQVVADLIAGFSTSPGHGHNYNDSFVTGWSAVAPADGWTDSDGARLQEILDQL
ncbi:MAG: alpha/beta-hydrolase family protein [Acidimicrobiales bacterium]|nr:alpha/beta-hydrolase family protein [Acidimicrobiales bacterium]